MLESLVVYSSLFIIMFVCGDISARRQKKYLAKKGKRGAKPPFLTPEMGVLSRSPSYSVAGGVWDEISSGILILSWDLSLNVMSSFFRR